MRWDDITILREVDRQQLLCDGGPLLTSGLDLMNSVAGWTMATARLTRGSTASHAARFAGPVHPSCRSRALWPLSP